MVAPSVCQERGSMPGLGSDQQNNRIAAVGEPKRASLADKPSLSRKDWAAGVMRDNIGLHLDVYVIAFMGIAFLGASQSRPLRSEQADITTSFGMPIQGIGSRSNSFDLSFSNSV